MADQKPELEHRADSTPPPPKSFQELIIIPIWERWHRGAKWRAAIICAVVLVAALGYGIQYIPQIIQLLKSDVSRTPQPLVETAETDIRVWVNTESRIYHCPGTQWYGRTRKGEYMTQGKALEAGYKAAYGHQCR
jgi:hypothetical protein